MVKKKNSGREDNNKNNINHDCELENPLAADYNLDGDSCQKAEEIYDLAESNNNDFAKSEDDSGSNPVPEDIGLIKTPELSVRKINKEETKTRSGFKNLPLYARILIIIFTCVFGIVAIGGGLFYWYINKANKIMNSITSSEIESILTPVESSQEPVSILILGRDSRDEENDLGRADTIMVLYLNPIQKRATLLSIPRDTLVDIPGHGKDKINAAYAFGGEELMIRAVSSFLDAKINHFITIDFDGFVKLIDALGGVDIIIERPLIDAKTGANFSPGKHHLTGEQALAYSRSRSTELADIGRIQRQQLLSKELINQKLNTQYLSKIPDYFNILVENTKTDLDLLSILKYAKAGLSFDSENFETAIIPTHSDWIENKTISVQIPDVDESKAMWQRILVGEPASKYNATYSIAANAIPDALATGMTYDIAVKVKNTGAIKWENGGSTPVFLGYHWINFDTKEMVVFDGKRSVLPQDVVNPDEEVTFDMKISSPPDKGKYILQIDLVKEGVTWFSYQGVPPLEKYCTLDISYSAQYDDENSTPIYLDPGQEFTSQVVVRNTGFLLWEHYKKVGRIDLGCHWINRDTGDIVLWDGPRGLLPNDIAHNEQAKVDMKINAPNKPGRYILQYDMVHESKTWFSEQGVIPLEININVGQTLDKKIAKNTTVKVFNGNGSPGSATQFIDNLTKYGFKVAKPSNAENFNFGKTILIYKTETLKKAEQLALILGSYEMVKYNSTDWGAYNSSSDVIIILGKDYAENIN
ncbi:MAG: LCP family protein [Actinomycetota bacterium]|nr:LCP family protein [Actinomycetota bacterium]